MTIDLITVGELLNRVEKKEGKSHFHYWMTAQGIVHYENDGRRVIDCEMKNARKWVNDRLKSNSDSSEDRAIAF